MTRLLTMSRRKTQTLITQSKTSYTANDQILGESESPHQRGLSAEVLEAASAHYA